MNAMRDSQYYFIFNCDEDGQYLFDYNAFGNVLIFDTTYKSNIYGKLLVVFVRCNNHKATILFGCSLLVDKMEETFHWLLSNFLISMLGKKPISIVTDVDDAMRNVVTTLILDARQSLYLTHRFKEVQGIAKLNLSKGNRQLIFPSDYFL